MSESTVVYVVVLLLLGGYAYRSWRRLSMIQREFERDTDTVAKGQTNGRD